MIPKESAAMEMETKGSLLLTKVNSVNRRKRMEATSMVRGGGEVRRVHIIYFLSRTGRVEQPHLIRVHHLHRNGVHLHDVKRWLADLRGKEMPEAFAWSYKRRYKNGYVWQDLQDDDLITPISDNEYVLKGSEIFVPSIPFDTSPFEPKKEDANAYEEKEAFEPKKMQVDEEERHQEQPSPREADLRTEYTPKKPTSEISEESVAFSSEMSSTLTEDSTKPEEDENNYTPQQEPEVDKVENLPPFFCSNLLGKKDKKKSDKDMDSDSTKSYEEKMGTHTSVPSSPQYLSQSPFPKSKSYSSGTSRMLRNLITCGAVDTNDAAVVAVKKQSPKQPNKSTTEICKAESTRVFGSCWNQQHSARKSFDGLKGSKKGNHQQHQKGFGSKKVVSPAYMPVGAPTCSQCGKPFRPEKLHSHMKSCKGRKSFARTRSTTAPSEKTSATTTTSTHTEESAGGYFLTS